MAITEISEDRLPDGKNTVVVDFYASWCGPCAALAPVIEEIVQAKEVQAAIYKCDIDQNVSLAEQFHVMSVPTLVIFKNGEEVSRLVGVQNRETIIQEIRRAE